MRGSRLQEVVIKGGSTVFLMVNYLGEFVSTSCFLLILSDHFISFHCLHL